MYVTQDKPADESEALRVTECQRLIDSVFETDPSTNVLVNRMKQAGCAIDRSTFVAVHCTKQIAGGFDTDAVELGGGQKIVLCSNHLGSAKEVANTMRHELIHAYDHCMAGAGGLDWTNLDKRACSEIRAAALSGDCSKLSEFSRSFSMHTEACIKRRAAKSLLGSCKTMREATGVVLRNYEACFADTQPFDNHPHTWC